MAQKILIVDDHVLSVAPLRMFLTSAGYTVVYAASAAEAAGMLRADPLPDLIVLDYMMPGVNGLEYLRTLRRDPRTRSMPVIMYSAVVESSYMAAVLAEGALHVWTKAATEFPQMLEDIQRLLDPINADRLRPRRSDMIRNQTLRAIRTRIPTPLHEAERWSMEKAGIP